MAEPVGYRIILKLSLKGRVIDSGNFLSSRALFQKLITKDTVCLALRGLIKYLPAYMRPQTCDMKKKKRKWGKFWWMVWETLAPTLGTTQGEWIFQCKVWSRKGFCTVCKPKLVAHYNECTNGVNSLCGILC